MAHQLLTRMPIFQGLFLIHMLENKLFDAEKEYSTPLNLLLLVCSIQLQPLHFVIVRPEEEDEPQLKSIFLNHIE